jgi:hypothetical protein
MEPKGLKGRPENTLQKQANRLEPSIFSLGSFGSSLAIKGFHGMIDGLKF